jgi:hypothetical protein
MAPAVTSWMAPTTPPDIDGFPEIFLSMEENMEGKAKKKFLTRGMIGFIVNSIFRYL